MKMYILIWEGKQVGHKWDTSGGGGRNQLAVPECMHTPMLAPLQARTPD